MKELIVFFLLLIAIIAGNSYGVLSIDITTFLLFILVIGTIIYRDRKKVKLEGIVLIRRTQKGKDFIDKTASSNRKFWAFMGTAGVVIAIVMLIFGSIFLINQAASVASGGQEGGVRLLLPGPVSAPTDLPGAFVVPWWIWIIGVAAVIIPHEFMHGIMCRIDKIKIKSVGWILLIVIPGAFVEPDEKQLKKAKRFTKMRVYAAGSFANIIMAMILFAILFFAVFPNFSPQGLVFTANESSAFLENTSGIMIGLDQDTLTSLEDLSFAMSKHAPGDTIEVKFYRFGDVLRYLEPNMPRYVIPDNSNFQSVNVTLNQYPGDAQRAYLGVTLYGERAFRFDPGSSFIDIVRLLVWMFVFSLGIGIVNILPIKPLDGGLLLEEIVGRFTKNANTVKNAVKLISAIMFAVLLFNLIGPIVF